MTPLSSADYRRKADFLSAQAANLQDEAIKRELLDLAQRYRKLAFHLARRRRRWRGVCVDYDGNVLSVLAPA